MGIKYYLHQIFKPVTLINTKSIWKVYDNEGTKTEALCGVDLEIKKRGIRGHYGAIRLR